MKKKVVFISEYMQPPYDEGIKKTVFQLYKILDQKYNLKVICREGDKSYNNIHVVKTNKLFLSQTIKKVIKNFSPDIVIYFPFASTTFAGFIRNYILSSYSSAKTLLIALQPKPLKRWQNLLIQLIKPPIVLTPSPLLNKRLNKLNTNSFLIPLFTDLTTFYPINEIKRKIALREKYNMSSDAFVISHVGHLNEGRNLRTLIPLQKNNNQVVIVGSSSTPKDSIGPISLKKELQDSGIIVLDGYIEKIEEIYQLSDLYIFPVEAQNSSIGMPLSILEARACGLPVLTTDFGSIKHFLGNDNKGIFYSKPSNFIQYLNKIKNSQLSTTTTSVKNLNEQFIEIINNYLS